MTRAGVKARLRRLLRRSRGGEEADLLLACLRALGDPPYWALGPAPADPERLLDAARGETFQVQDRMTRLSVPVDWQQGEEHGPAWRLHLHSFGWLDALLRHPGNDSKLLELALALVTDWAESHPPGEHDDSDLAWSAMATAVRAPIFAHVLRACGYRGLLDGQQATGLRNAVIAHGRSLADGSNYASRSDAGLYQDAGLVLVADYLPFLPQSPKWRRHGKRRFISNLRERVQWEEAICLERPPQSQFRLHALAAGLMHHMEIEDQSANRLLERMGEAASWFVMPNGSLPKLGDSDPTWEPPQWALEGAELHTGSMVAPHSGYAVVKEAESYLIVSAGHHPEVQARADQLTFCLFCDGTRVIEDAGPEEPSVLVVDGQGNGSEGSDAHGKGITASGEGERWYAILGENPLRPQGVRHRRLFLFQPALGLIVVDRVEAGEPHRYTRSFHLGSGLSVEGDRVVGERYRGTIADYSGTAQRRRVIGGQGQPASVEFTSEGTSDTFVASISLQPDPLAVTSAEWRDDASIRVLIATGEQAEELMVAVRDSELLVESVAPRHLSATPEPA